MKYLQLCKAYKELEENPSRLKKTEVLSEFLKLLKHDKNKETVYLLKGRIFPDYDTREVGISTQLAIKAMSKSTGISEKEIIKLWKKTGDLGEIAEEISKKKKQSSLFSTELTVKKVLENLQKLPDLEGKGTVDKKMGLISELLVSASPLETKYIIRTLLGDLRTGTGEGVLRDAITWACLDKEKKEDFNLIQEAYDTTTDFAEVFEKACKSRSALENLELSPGRPLKVMLAQKAESIADGFEAVGKPAACFPKGELIFSNPSVKNVEDFHENEAIIGKCGRYQKILKVFERPYKGEILRVYPHYLFPFSITPEHRVLTIKEQLCSWKNRKISCRPNCQEQKYGCKRKYESYKPKWTEARNIEKGDFVLFPKFKETKIIEEIDLTEFNRGKKVELNENKIRSYNKTRGTFKGNWINRKINLSNEFFELMGWYLAEGSFDRSGVKFSLSYKEEKEAQRIKEIIKHVFGIEAKISHRKSVIEIKAHSVLLPEFFKESFNNYSTNKKIPLCIMLAKEDKVKEFIKAYIKGDGHKTKNNIYVIATASKNIAHQIVFLLSKIKILPSVAKYKNKGLGDIIYKIAIFGKQIDYLQEKTHNTKTSHQRFFEDENFFYIPIKKIETQNYNGNVFNFETEDNTYLSSAIVHNCEYKYDGFRMLINKDKNGEIKIFTRRLEEVTKQFPEVKDYIKKHVKGNSFIIDSEAVGFSPKNHKYKPFQDISQRIKRKYDIEKVQKELPVEINAFDVLYYDGKSMIQEPFSKRRALLEKIIKPEKWKLILAKQIITDNEKEAEKFYQEALKEGEEGVMIKSLSSPYKPGARVGHMLKLKPSANEFDLVIVKAESGTGKRGGWLTSFTVACRRDNEFLEIGKVSTGLKEKASEGLSFEEMTAKLKPLIKSEKGREVEVKPEVVITVVYQDIQKSPSYSSGFALRFPRFKVVREDRSMRDIATIEEVERDYEKHWKWRVV